MTLFDIIAQSQDGQAIDNLAAEFGLNRAETEAAVRQIAPALATGLARNTEDGKGLANLVGALSVGDHRKYLEEPSLLTSQNAIADGNGILGHILGSKTVSRQIAERISTKTGISSTIVKKMLPVIATLVMGALAKKMAGAGSREIADSVLKRVSNRSGSWLGTLLAKAVTSGFVWMVLKKLVFGSGKSKRTDIFGSLLDKDGDGSYVDDLIGMAAKGLIK